MKALRYLGIALIAIAGLFYLLMPTSGWLVMLLFVAGVVMLIIGTAVLRYRTETRGLSIKDGT